jgi:hypothetical protein
MKGLVPVRHPITPATDHPVESLAGRYQCRPAVSRDHTLDQRVDDGIGDTADILRSPYGRCPRGKRGPQRVTWCAGEAEPLHDDVEIKIVHTLSVLHRIDDTHASFDAQDPEILDEGIVMRKGDWVVDEEFDDEQFILGAHALSVPDETSSLLQQCTRLPQQGAVLTRPV